MNKLNGKDDRDADASCKRDMATLESQVPSTPSELPAASRWRCRYQTPSGTQAVEHVELDIAQDGSVSATGGDSFGVTIAGHGRAGGKALSYAIGATDMRVLHGTATALQGDIRYVLSGESQMDTNSCYTTKIACTRLE